MIKTEKLTSEIAEIKKRSQQGTAYALVEQDWRRIIEILIELKDFEMREVEMADATHFVNQLLTVIMNTVNRDFAKNLRGMFNDYEFGNWFIKSQITGQLMRIAGF